MERAASQLREGEPTRFERISDYATADLAYILEIERTILHSASSRRKMVVTRSETGAFASAPPTFIRTTSV